MDLGGSPPHALLRVLRPVPSPAIAAMLMPVISLGAIGLAFGGMRAIARRQGLGTQGAGEVTRFDLGSGASV
jgi:hypothetical protein